MLRFTEKEMILFHLESFEEFKKEDEVPYLLTPRGISKTVGISEDAPFETLKSLEEKGLIKEEERSIIGLNRKRNVYFLTDKGKASEKNFWEKIKDENVTLFTEDDEKELKLKNIKNHISGRNPIVKCLRIMDEDGIIDLSKLEEGVEVFVGRDEELMELKNNLWKARDGDSQLCFIEGEAGIGKTSLISKIKPYANELGFEFLIGTCQSETSDPYLPFKEAFSDYIEGDADSEASIGMAFIGAGGEDESIQVKKLFDAKKQETFYETTQSIEKIADENPLVIFLDDLQWVDKATLDILAYMNDKLKDSPIFFVGTYRPEDVSEDHHLVEMMHRLDRKNGFGKISLDPLSLKNTKDIIKGVLGTEKVPDSFVKRIHHKTEGNPLFIKESIKQMLDEDLIDVDKGIYPEKKDEISVSDMVHNVIERRINRLDNETIKVIEMGAVIGDSIPFELLSRTVDLDEIDLLDHIDILIDNQLWEEDPSDETFYFFHDLIQETVYKRVKKLKKRLLHKRVAKNIEDDFEDLEKWYSDLGRHYERAGDPTKGFDYYVKAGEKAEGMFANEDAVEMYERSLGLVENIEEYESEKLNLMEKIADSYSLLGNFQKTREYLNKCLEFTEDRKEKQRYYRKIAETYHHQGDWDTALKYVEKGLSLQVKENKETCELLGIQAAAYQKKGEYDKAHRLTKKEKELAEELGGEKQLGDVYHDLGTVLTRKGELKEAKTYLRKAIDLREKNKEKLELYKSLNNMAIVYKDLGEYKNSKEYFERALKVVKKNNLNSEFSGIYNNIGFIYSEMGLINKAIEPYQKSIEWGEKTGDKETKALAIGNIGNVYLKKGDLDKARNNIEKAIDMMEELGHSYGLVVNLQYLGDLEKKEGKIENAEQAYRKSLKIAKKTGLQKRKIIALYRLGGLKIILGDFDKADEVFNKAIDVAYKIGAKDTESIARGKLGMLYLKKGEVEKAEDLFKKGLELGETANDEKSLMINKIGMGEVKIQKNKEDDAKQFCSSVSRLLKEYDFSDIYIQNKILGSRCLKQSGQIKKSISLVEEALDESRNAKDKIWEGICLLKLSQLYLKCDDKEKGKKFLEDSLEIFKKTNINFLKEKAEKIFKEAE